MTKDQYKKWQDSGRASTKQRGYDAAWKRIRAKLSVDPFCQLNRTEGCTKEQPRIADTVDHIKPIRIAPGLRLDLTNLQSACRAVQ